MNYEKEDLPTGVAPKAADTDSYTPAQKKPGFLRKEYRLTYIWLFAEVSMRRIVFLLLLSVAIIAGCTALYLSYRVPLSALDGWPMTPGSVHKADVWIIDGSSEEGVFILIVHQASTANKTVALRLTDISGLKVVYGANWQKRDAGEGVLTVTVPYRSRNDDNLYNFQSWEPKPINNSSAKPAPTIGLTTDGSSTQPISWDESTATPLPK